QSAELHAAGRATDQDLDEAKALALLVRNGTRLVEADGAGSTLAVMACDRELKPTHKNWTAATLFAGVTEIGRYAQAAMVYDLFRSPFRPAAKPFPPLARDQ